jgi:hypothetical protein
MPRDHNSPSGRSYPVSLQQAAAAVFGITVIDGGSPRPTGPPHSSAYAPKQQDFRE